MHGTKYPEGLKNIVLNNPKISNEEVCKIAREQFGMVDLNPEKIRHMRYRLLQKLKFYNNTDIEFNMYSEDDNGEITYRGIASEWRYAYRSVRKRLLNNKNEVAYIICNDHNAKIGFYYNTMSNSIELDSIESLE